MKRVLIVLFVAVMLLSGCNGVVPPPPEEAEKFVGLWVNESQDSINVTRCQIELIDKYLYINVWVRISQTSENYIGQQQVAVEEARDGVIELIWNDDLGVTVDELVLINDKKLKLCSTFTPFNPDWHVVITTDYLKKVE